MNICAMAIHNPLSSNPIRPLSLATVCMTKGNIVPLDKWNVKQMNMKMIVVESLNI
jgi:hypothetical protein